MQQPGLPDDLPTSAGMTAGAKDPNAAPQSMPQKIGRYKILRLIGEGGTGAVYEAEQDQEVTYRSCGACSKPSSSA